MITGNPAFASSLVARPGVRQLVKFCIVGASSTVIDLTIFNILLSLSVPPVFAVVGGFIGGVSNGFYWNRRWTFKGRQGSMAKQGPIFFATNLVGLTLNILVTTLALVVAAHYHLTQTHFSPEETMRLILFRQADGQGFSRLALNAAKLCATVVVTAWNFSASKFITFKA
ncbi:MAG: GtrA family protein [Cytophagales bacterium]|nr:GtrA family protein [Armatimonadota bacterium]